MNFIESFKSAIKSLTGNRARSFLTMLGIIIGITSVITMSAIGKGGQKYYWKTERRGIWKIYYLY